MLSTQSPTDDSCNHVYPSEPTKTPPPNGKEVRISANEFDTNTSRIADEFK
jgi:hypothetical protein